MSEKEQSDTYLQARNNFISQWGALGSSWGINRTMAQVHAMLMISAKPLCTQDIMDDLQISRGNANTNLRELVSWGLVRTQMYKSDRKEYFEAEKDVWKIFCIVSRERKKREIAPALQVLQECRATQTKAKTGEEDAFYKQIQALEDFVKLADSIMDKVSNSERSKIIPKVLKIF